MKKEQAKNTNRILDSKGFWMVFSLLAAILLWTYVTSTEGVEVEKVFSNVKIVFSGAEALRESSGLIVTEQDISSVDLTLKATRRVITKLNSANITAAIDLSRVVTDGRYSVSYEINYPNTVSSDEVTVVRCSADVVNFYVDRQTRKTVPVEGEFLGSTEEGYLADDSLIFDPMVVTVSGPKTAVNAVDHAYIAITRMDVDKTLQFSTTYELRDAEGNPVDDADILLDTQEVTVTLNVLSTKLVPLDVTIVNGGGATRDENTKITIVPASVLLSGDAAAIDSVSKIVLGSIDLSDFASGYSATYTIVPPDSTDNLSGVSEASVSVEIVGLSTEVFTLGHDNISCINVPEGYNAEIHTQALSVTVRGPAEQISQMNASNLRAVADLSDISVGVSGVINPYARIYIDGYPDVGVIGDYSIYVGLTQSDAGE